MSKLVLSLAMGDYDRTRPIEDGTTPIAGVDPVVMHPLPEEMFLRAFHHRAYDITELSFSSYLLTLARGDCPYVGLPVFLSRAFRHGSIYVRTDRIKSPEDLRGARIGVPEYQLTAIVWARELLREDFGIQASDATWVRGGIEQPGRKEKIRLKLPPSIRVETAPDDDTLSAMLDRGNLDAFIAPRPPSCAGRNPRVASLYRDPLFAAQEYYRRTSVFPIMRIVAVRRTLVDDHPWLPVAVYDAFERARRLAVSRLMDSTAAMVTLPFVDEQLVAARRLMGDDFWRYGVDDNRPDIETFLRAHFRQGLSPRLLAAEEVFHSSTYETVRI